MNRFKEALGQVLDWTARVGDALGLSSAFGGYDRRGLGERLRRLAEWQQLGPDQRLRLLGKSLEPIRPSLGAAAAQPAAGSRAAAPDVPGWIALGALTLGAVALLGG
ncbi:MAG TPA: hypothetical protein VNN07_03925 [Candidatus Tectomicrobia bacterium]|nr:hypothetical protein [Candidatus Tectomicrobia bacterium]